MHCYILDASAGGKGFLVEGLNGPSIHIHIPSLGAKDCPDDVCEYFIEAKPVNPPVGTTSNSVSYRMTSILDQGETARVFYSEYGVTINYKFYKLFQTSS